MELAHVELLVYGEAKSTSEGCLVISTTYCLSAQVLPSFPADKRIGYKIKVFILAIACKVMLLSSLIES
jgi:hypothetical protein